MGSPAAGPGINEYDHSFKVVLVGDSSVGKSSLLLRFMSDHHEMLPTTVGADFRIKFLTVGGKKVKLTIWDTAGQERLRTLTNSYYRGSHGIIMVYDVTKRDTFTNLGHVWAKEIEVYETNRDSVKMLIGNKVDKESDRTVTKEEASDVAREKGCSFIECSAKTGENVSKCFEELVAKILQVPRLLEEGSAKKDVVVVKPKQEYHGSPGGGSSCCP